MLCLSLSDQLTRSTLKVAQDTAHANVALPAYPSESMMSSCPLMVYVLPEPVCPYAKMVAWYPAIAAFSSCVMPQIFKTSDCLEVGAKQPWNVKLRVMTEPLSPGTMTCSASRRVS